MSNATPQQQVSPLPWRVVDNPQHGCCWTVTIVDANGGNVAESLEADAAAIVEAMNATLPQ
jgi:hypothetical protein